MSESGDATGKQAEPAADLDDVTVLLVDDDETWAASTAQVLEHQRESFAVETATNLDAASRRFAATDPDCVVSDYRLVDATGLDLLSVVRDRDDERPFILITGRGDESVASDAIGRAVTDYIPKRSLGGRDDLLARRIEAAVESYRTRRALERERETKTALLDVITAATGGTDLPAQVCSQLVEERGYACAWVGHADESGRPLPAGAAGAEAYVDRVVGPAGVPPADEPACRALAGDELVVATVDADADAGERGGESEGWRRAAADCGFERAVAVPVGHEGVRHGVLAVYDADPTVPADRERAAVAEYADAVGYALGAADRKRSLMADRPQSVTVEVADSALPLVALSAVAADARCEVRSAVPRDDGTTLYVATVEGAAPSAVADRAAAVDAIESATVGDDTPVGCEVVVRGRTPEGVLASHGGRFERTVVEDGTATVSVRLPDITAVRTVDEALSAAFTDVTVSRVWTDPTDRETVTSVADLTERQRTVLRHAFDVGYYRRPRETNATELADHLDIARATLTQHLRAAERKLVGGFFGDE
ncbi:bacterio-opsin activator domain-containing protein [Halosimplex halobium]|uniref:bacterio-opsin activator domain-containing protein n=1 Tax=Halosimplex halobium TaxID=3396618 RepID=UPI003F56301D